MRGESAAGSGGGGGGAGSGGGGGVSAVRPGEATRTNSHFRLKSDDVGAADDGTPELEVERINNRRPMGGGRASGRPHRRDDRDRPSATGVSGVGSTSDRDRMHHFAPPSVVSELDLPDPTAPQTNALNSSARPGGIEGAASDRAGTELALANSTPDRPGGVGLPRRPSRTQIGSVVVTINGRALGLRDGTDSEAAAAGLRRSRGEEGGSTSGGTQHPSRYYGEDDPNASPLGRTCGSYKLKPWHLALLAACFMAGIVTSFVLQRKEQIETGENTFVSDCTFAASHLRTLLESSLTTLMALRALFESRPAGWPEPTSEQVQNYWASLRNDSSPFDPVVLAAWAPFINQTGRVLWEAEFGQLQFFNLSMNDGIARPLPPSFQLDTYLPLRYVVPENAFGPANVTHPTGLDIISSFLTQSTDLTNQRESLEIAKLVAGGGALFAVPISGTESGIAVLLPVHARAPSPSDTYTEVNGEVIASNPSLGMVLGVLSVQSLLYRAAEDSVLNTLQLSFAPVRGSRLIATTSTDPEDQIPLTQSDSKHSPIPFVFAGQHFVMQCRRNRDFSFDEAALWATSSALFVLSVLMIGAGYKAVSAERESNKHNLHSAGAIRELETINQKLVEQQRIAQAANKSKSNLMSFICHELRNPLHIQNAMIELLLESGDDRSPDERDHLNTIRSTADLMLFIVNDVLDINRIDDGKMRFEQLSFNLHQFVNGLAHAMAPAATTRRIRLSVAIDPRTPMYVIGDVHRCRQVLTNLLQNAIKFTKPPNGCVKLGVTVRPAPPPTASGGLTQRDQHSPPAGPVGAAASERVPTGGRVSPSGPGSPAGGPATAGGAAGGTIRAGTPGKGAGAGAGSSGWTHLEFFVEDNGIGIAPDVLKHLFTPFEQGSANIAREYGGSGLGLSIVNRIVGLMGGTVSVESQQGVGSTFRVRLSLPISAGPSSNAVGTSTDFKVWTTPVAIHTGPKTRPQMVPPLSNPGTPSPPRVHGPVVSTTSASSSIAAMTGPPNALAALSVNDANGLASLASGSAFTNAVGGGGSNNSSHGTPIAASATIGPSASQPVSSSANSTARSMGGNGSPTNASQNQTASQSGNGAAAAPQPPPQSAAHLRANQPIRRTLSVGSPISAGVQSATTAATTTGAANAHAHDDSPHFTGQQPPTQAFHYNSTGSGAGSVPRPLINPRVSAVNRESAYTASTPGASGSRESNMNTPIVDGAIALTVTDGVAVTDLNSGTQLTGVRPSRLITQPGASAEPSTTGSIHLPGLISDSPPELSNLPLSAAAAGSAPGSAGTGSFRLPSNKLIALSTTPKMSGSAGASPPLSAASMPDSDLTPDGGTEMVRPVVAGAIPPDTISLPSTNAIKLSRNTDTNTPINRSLVAAYSRLAADGSTDPASSVDHKQPMSHPIGLPISLPPIPSPVLTATGPSISGTVPPPVASTGAGMSLAARAAAGMNIGIDIPGVTHVLIVDDNAPNCMVLARMLKEFSTYVAYNGKQAVDAVTTAINVNKRPFDLILMDINMPVMDGWTAVRKLRSMGVTAPVVALTANAMVEDQQKCIVAGFNGFMSKPFNKNDILKLVAAMIPASAQSAPMVQAATTLPPPAMAAGSQSPLVSAPSPSSAPYQQLQLSVVNNNQSQSGSVGTTTSTPGTLSLQPLQRATPSSPSQPGGSLGSAPPSGVPTPTPGGGYAGAQS